MHAHITDFGANAQRSVRGQSPRGGSPSSKAGSTPRGHLLFGVHNAEQSSCGGVLNVAVAAGLVQLVSRKTSTCTGRIGLDGVTFIEQALLVELFEHPPEGLDIFIVVGDVGVVGVYPVTHLTGQITPHVGVLHHSLAAGAVVLLDGDFASDFVLGDAEFLLDTKFYGQTVGVPAGFTIHFVALAGFVTADDVFDGTCHHMVNTRHTVCRGRSFVENERGRAFALQNALTESVFAIPFFQYFL